MWLQRIFLVGFFSLLQLSELSYALPSNEQVLTPIFIGHLNTDCRNDTLMAYVKPMGNVQPVEIRWGQKRDSIDQCPGESVAVSKGKRKNKVTRFVIPSWDSLQISAVVVDLNRDGNNDILINYRGIEISDTSKKYKTQLLGILGGDSGLDSTAVVTLANIAPLQRKGFKALQLKTPQHLEPTEYNQKGSRYWALHTCTVPDSIASPFHGKDSVAEGTLSLSESLVDSHISIKPQPADDNIEVRFFGIDKLPTNSEALELHIYSSGGRLIAEHVIEKNLPSIELSTKNWATGSYTLTLTVGNTIFSSSRCTIIH